MPNNNKPGIGHNRPTTVDTSHITGRLAKDYAAAEDRARELLAEARKLPTTVRNEDGLERYSLVIRNIREHTSSVEAFRKAEKDPYLRGGEAVDGFFNSLKERLAKASRILHSRADEYQQEKLERARAAQAEAERKAFEEAQRFEEEARRARSEKRKGELEIEAKLANQRAAMAEAQAAQGIANPAGVARTRFESGAMATMAKAPTATVLDYDAVPLDQLRPYLKREWIDQAVRAWARATSFRETMAGVSIEHGTKTVIR